MTVGELRQRLAALPDDLEIARANREEGLQEITGVTQVYELLPAEWYRWSYDTAEEAEHMKQDHHTGIRLVGVL